MAAAASSSSKQKQQFFQTTQRGEIKELQLELNSNDKSRVKEAVKKVIEAMTVDKDVSALFADVTRYISSDNIEMKKLIFLYISNYAKSLPEKSIMVLNAISRDATSDSNPIIRALAIRTMGTIRIPNIASHLGEALMKTLKDKDPYVRKTAAICCTKLFAINHEVVEQKGFIDALRELISDSNPMVVSNAVVALSEISDALNKDVFKITSQLLEKILFALEHSAEWGQVFLLDSLGKFQPTAQEAEQIIEQVTPLLKHANTAVTMSTVKVIMRYLKIVASHNSKLEKKLVSEVLPPPLITLLSEGKPEIQYVVLRNINLIVQRRPDILEQDVKSFFCKYFDPIYIKLEKLEIMIRLASESNIDQLLLEFKEYASEVDIDFVRKSVRAVGRCAIKIEPAASKCVKVLLEIIKTYFKNTYVVQEAIIIIKDIFRKYPNKYEHIIATLCQHLGNLDEPEAKASMIWIIGEYAGRIDNSPEIMESFLTNFEEEASIVQLQLLTATVKLFLKKPAKAKDLMTKVLKIATDNVDNPDLRDRGYIYYRLLVTKAEVAMKIVWAEKPAISDETFQLDANILDGLINNLASLASIYHKPPETFVKGSKTVTFHSTDEKSSDDEEDSKDATGTDTDATDTDDTDDEKTAKSPKETKTKEAAAAVKSSNPVDLLGLGDLTLSGPSSPPATTSPQQGGAAAAQPSFLADLMKPVTVAQTATSAFTGPSDRAHVVVPAAQGNGLQVSTHYVRTDSGVNMVFTLNNQTQSQLKQFMVRFNNNYIGIAPGTIQVSPVDPGATVEAVLPLALTGTMTPNFPPNMIQVALKTDLGVCQFKDFCPIYHFFGDDGDLGKSAFLDLWRSLNPQDEVAKQLNSKYNSVDAVKQILTARKLFVVTQLVLDQKGDVVFMSCKLRDTPVCIEFSMKNGVSRAAARSTNKFFSALVVEGIDLLLQN